MSDLSEKDKKWIKENMEIAVRDGLREMMWPRLDEGDRNRARLLKLLANIFTKLGGLEGSSRVSSPADAPKDT